MDKINFIRLCEHGCYVRTKIIWTENYITNEHIHKQILNFINFHFNYTSKYFTNKYNSVTSINKLLNSQIPINVHELSMNKNKINIQTLANVQIIHEDFYELFCKIIDDYQDEQSFTNPNYGWVMINFDKNISINYYTIKPCSYEDYCKYSMFVHLNECSNKYDNNKTILENYKLRLLDLQGKSNYSLKLFDIKSMNDSNFKFILKNKDITCPKPDCFMIKFK